MSPPRPDIGLLVDFDGVISPVHGHTDWGDDIEATRLLGPGLISPAMCQALSAIAEMPKVSAWWLTDWDRDMRVMGAKWSSVAEPHEGRARAATLAGDRWSERPWWKWWSVQEWLDDHPDLKTVIWCDDDLGTPVREDDEWPSRSWLDEASKILDQRGVRHLLLARASSTGWTKSHLHAIRRTGGLLPALQRSASGRST